MKAGELEGAQLDAAVAQAEGRHYNGEGSEYRPSTDWQWGGPIIERERIKLTPPDEGETLWVGQIWRPGWEAVETVSGSGEGPTPLIAAMRAYVASKFGDNLPE